MLFAAIFPEIGGVCAELNARLSSGGQSETWLFNQLSAVIQQRKASMEVIFGDILNGFIFPFGCYRKSVTVDPMTNTAPKIELCLKIANYI